MSWKKIIVRKFQISTTDTDRQSQQSEVDDVWQITEKPAAQLIDAPLDLTTRKGEIQSFRNVPEVSNESHRRQDGRSARENSSLIGASQKPKSTTKNKNLEDEFAHASTSSVPVGTVVSEPSLAFRQPKPLRSEHIPARPSSGLPEKRRRRNVQPSSEMPSIEGTPMGSIVEQPQRESGSGCWKEIIKQNEVSQPEPIQEFQQEPEDPIPGPSSQTIKVRNLKRKNGSGIEGNTQGAKLKRKSSSVGQDSNAVTIKPKIGIGKCCECGCTVKVAQMFNHFFDKHNGKKALKCTASQDCKRYFATLEKRKEHEQHEHEEREKLRCPDCHYSTNVRSELDFHVQRKHSEKTIKCTDPKCSKMFASQALLTIHLKEIHTMETCPKCGKEMSINSLRMHKKQKKCVFIKV